MSVLNIRKLLTLVETTKTENSADPQGGGARSD